MHSIVHMAVLGLYITARAAFAWHKPFYIKSWQELRKLARYIEKTLLVGLYEVASNTSLKNYLDLIVEILFQIRRPNYTALKMYHDI